MKKTTLDAACWVCGAPANSAEHRLKKADVVRAYGKGPYRGPLAPMHVRGGVQTPIQGPRSEKIKYPPSLCYECNTTRTQPYDIAYDRFISWILANEHTVLRKRFVNFENVYGSSFEASQRDLFKYFVKSFGCRLFQAGREVPQDLVALFPLDRFNTGLRITFAVNEDILLLPKEDRDSWIGKGGLIASMSQSNPELTNAYSWHESVSWLWVFYWYMAWPESDLGSIWIADTQTVYLGSHAPLSDHQRAEFVENIRVQAAAREKLEQS